MAFSTSSYFAGVGTVFATMAVGFGGGILMTDAFVGKSETQLSKLEQRATEARAGAPPQVAPAPVPAGAQAAAEPVPQPIEPNPQMAVQALAPMQRPALPQGSPVQQPASIQQQPVVGPAIQHSAPQSQVPTITPLNSALARTEDANAKTKDAEVHRELKRKKQIRRAERQKVLADRKRRKQEEMRAVVERVQQQEPREDSQMADRVRHEGPRQEPRLLVREVDADDSPPNRLFRMD